MPSLYCTQGPMLIWGRFALSGNPIDSVRSVNKYYGETFDRKLAKSPKHMAEAVGVRAIFNPANLFDSYFFRWTTYLDNDEDAGADFRDQKNQEIQNVGLLSALLFTVAYDMMNGVGDSNPETFWGRAYLVSWALSQAFFLAATILTVVFTAAITETATESELRLFFSILDKTTFNYGSLIHIFAMFGGVVFFFIGSIALCFSSFEGLGSVLLMGAMVPAFVLAVCVLLATVSALRTARTTSRVLYGGEKKINISAHHIQQYLVAFVDNNCGGASLDDLDESDE
jgi:hypothetical protein